MTSTEHQLRYYFARHCWRNRDVQVRDDNDWSKGYTWAVVFHAKHKMTLDEYRTNYADVDKAHL